MLVKRLLVILVALPIGVAMIFVGGFWYALLIAAGIGVAAWEYNRLFRKGGYEPSSLIIIGGSAALVLGRYFFGFQGSDTLISFLVLLSMAYHLVRYELGRDKAATDFGVTLGGVLYLGWLGAYLVSLRELPDGIWWVLLVLPAVWSADAGAYWIGSRWGKHPMSPRLSPHKTWEGYFAGLVTGIIGGAVIASLWNQMTPAIDPARGAILGLILAVLAPLGDLGESMIKRQFGAKDSSHLIPGHGGMMDRIDSWLWAGVIGYALITWLWL
jgi:phosphatidate cytidylyltransferase